MNLNDSFRIVAASRGFPRAGVFSPVLWCHIFDDLIMILNRGGVYTQGYANYICLLAVGKFPNMVSGLMQETIESWCSKIGLSVNPDKTEFIVLPRKRIIFGFFEPLLELLWTILRWLSILGSPGFLAEPEEGF